MFSIKEEDKDVYFERNFLRDRQTFKNIKKRDKEVGKVSIRPEENVFNFRKEVVDVALSWDWECDPNQNRGFLIPAELAKYLSHIHFVRDVLAALTTLYCRDKPENGRVVTTFLEICKYMGLSANGRVYNDINNSLAFLRAYTIRQQNVPVKRVKKGVEWGQVDFGFVDFSVVVTSIETAPDVFEPVPINQRRVEIKLSDCYVDLLKKSAIHAIPIAAITAARGLPRSHIVPAKNIIYNLAARSGKKATLKESTLVEITGLRPRRRSESKKAVDRLLANMETAGIIQYKINEKGGQRIISIRLLPNT